MSWKLHIRPEAPRPSADPIAGLDVWEGEGGSVASEDATGANADALAWSRDLDMRGWG